MKKKERLPSTQLLVNFKVRIAQAAVSGIPLKAEFFLLQEVVEAASG